MNCSLALQSSPNVFITGSSDLSVKVWDIRSSKCVQTFDSHKSEVNAVQFFPSGKAFVSAADDGTCKLFDLRADTEVMRYSHESIAAAATSVDLSVSGRLIFAGHDDYKCYIWDTLKGERVGILAGHENRISCLGVSGDGVALCTGSWDASLKVNRPNNPNTKQQTDKSITKVWA